MAPQPTNRPAIRPALLAQSLSLALIAATPLLIHSQTTPQPAAQQSQTGPASGAQPAEVIIHSDKPLTPDEEAKLKAKAAQMHELPPSNPLVPGFELETPEGAKITLNDLHGKVVLLDYWATWCAPCIEGLPELEAVYQKYRSNPRVAILAVNPLMGDTPEKIHAFYEQKHLTVPLAFDKHFAEPKPVAEAGDPVSSISLPTVLLLDREGKQQWFSVGGTVSDADHAFQTQLIAKIDAQLAQK